MSDKMKDRLAHIAMAMVAIIAIMLTLKYWIDLSAFAIALGKISLFCAFVWFYIDRVLFRRMNTIDELKKGNVAYALVLSAFVVGCFLCIALA